MKARRVLAACLLAWAATSAFAADYWEAQADHVAVIASGGAERAADLAADFVRVEQAFTKLAVPHAPPARPLIVFALTENDARATIASAKELDAGVRFHPQGYRSDPRSVSRYFTLAGGNVVAFAGHKNYELPLQRAYGLHGGALAYTTFPSTYPRWYALGLDGLFADVHVDSASGTVRFEHDLTAVSIPKTRATQTRPLTLARALQIEPGIEKDPDAWLVFQLYSQNMMYYATIERPDRRPVIDLLAQRLAGGETAAQLAETMQSPTFTELEQELDQTLRRRTWKTLRLAVPGPTSVTPPKQMSDETVRARLEQLKQIAVAFK
jgi:hypothetical protein